MLLNWYALPLFLSFVVIVVSSSLSMSTLSLSCSPFIQMLLSVFLLSDRYRFTGTFIHLDLISCILEFIFTRSSLVWIRFLSWMTEEEKGLSDLRVNKLYLVLAGLIRIMLFFYVNRVTPPLLFLYWIVASISIKLLILIKLIYNICSV